MRKKLRIVLLFLLSLFLSALVWLGFVAFQHVNYSEPDQIYFMGTALSYGFVYFFFLVVINFLITFYIYRHQPEKLKISFIIFAVFYLIFAPLVILSFDNYLLVTPKGLVYNEFWDIEDTKVKRWRDIKQVELDYTREKLSLFRNEKWRLKYLVYFHDGQVVDLNHYNSPLYSAEEFHAIHRTMIKQNVPIKNKRPLPPDISEKSFIYEMFNFQKQQNN